MLISAIGMIPVESNVLLKLNQGALKMLGWHSHGNRPGTEESTMWKRLGGGIVIFHDYNLNIANNVGDVLILRVSTEAVLLCSCPYWYKMP